MQAFSSYPLYSDTLSKIGIAVGTLGPSPTVILPPDNPSPARFVAPPLISTCSALFGHLPGGVRPFAGDLTAAARSFRAAFRLNHSDVNAFLNLAIAYASLAQIWPGWLRSATLDNHPSPTASAVAQKSFSCKCTYG